MSDEDGYKIGSAYIEVHLRDETDSDAAKIRSKVESGEQVNLKSHLENPDNVAAIREAIEQGRPAKMPVEADTSQAKAALGDLTATVDKSTQDNNSRFQGMLRSTTVGWTALGALVAGPAVAGGLAVVAGGFTAIAIAAEHSSPQVQQAFNTMKTEGIESLKTGFSSLTPVIVTSLGTMTDGIRGLTPEIQTISGELGPFVSTLSGSLVKAAQTDLPAFSTALGNAAPMARALGTGIDDVATGIGQFTTRLDFSQASTGLQALLSDVGRLLPVVAGLVNAIMPFSNALLTSVIPAASNLANVFIGSLTPAIHAIGAAITAVGPLLNFMSGPAASVLVGVVAFKALQAATNGLVPIFNTMSAGASAFANKALEMSGATGSSVGTFSLLTDGMKAQEVQSAKNALAAARQAAVQATVNQANVESAAAAGTSVFSEEQLVAVRAQATAATQAEAEATAALASAEEATSFAFGPVGIAIGAVVAGLSLLTLGHANAGASAQAQAQREQTLAQALKDSGGAIDANVRATAAGTLADFDAGDGKRNLLEDVRKLLGNDGITSLTDSYLGNADAQKALVTQLRAIQSQHTKVQQVGRGTQSEMDSTAQSAKQLADIIGGPLGTTFADAVQKNKDVAAASQTTAQAVTLTSAQQSEAAEVAQRYGLSVGVVAGAFARLPSAADASTAGVAGLTSAFSDQEVKLLSAEQSTTDYFKNLQKNADQAAQALAGAQHSYQQSVTAVADAEHSAAQAAQAVTTAREGVAAATRSVTDAEHSYTDAQHSAAQAQQSVIDAEAGVITAENNLAKAQDSERQAQVALTDARKAAAEQLKSLHLQLNDQIVSEQQAQIKLFDQTRTSAGAGVTADNAQSILAAPLTAQNEALKQSALDLISAQNAVADTMNTGVNLREQVAAADKAGVDGSQQVISAQQAVKSAQDQVLSSEQALVKSHQQVQQAVYSLQDANYALGKAQQAIVDAQAGVVRAQQGVTDAVYNEQKARGAVKDAIFNEQQALFALKQAQDAARTANDLNTHSLDLNTQAGRNNWAQLQQLFNSYPAWMTDQQKYNQMIDDTASSFNGSKQAAFDFLQQEGKIPKNFTFSVTGMTTVDMTPLANWANDKSGYFKGGFRSAGGAIGFATGGEVRGPGGPRDDLIDAKLSDGEFVQPTDVVDHYGLGYMEALRQKKIPKFASGGLVDGVSLNLLAAGFGAGYEFIRNTDILAGADPGSLPQLSAYVPPQISGGAAGAIPTGQHLALIDAALSADGIPRSEWARWEAGMNVLIGRESSWNAGAVNNWDSNAKAGHPSGGLTQTIGPTFERYRNRSLPDNMFDPVANIAASIRYILSTYGDISHVQQANPNLPHKGYALGDIVGADGASLLPTMPRVPSIVPPKSERVLGDNPRFDESYIPNDPNDPQAQHILDVTNRRMGKGGNTIHQYINIQQVQMDADRTAAVVSSRLGWAMRGA
ncbi:hypothetical protein AB0383_49745 [Amycolatopsis sp. NPDC051373]|uniref:hypothetical protein n=1 Tax=Amycolatopsis sp. NPDC051373 TaxID=3155801 RepID=UPI00344EBD23